ncbi:magnesium-translocating P-type ATPase [Geomonas nitrogeniifigens]|uniref:Magnesium-transporting ATPase, P-type 1 n=1 Tax=Geomonas diazotrophica TaxID=2843197 RepID=A0ABX8JK72_9BACT|nr:magnesium-translocating P-type ATPase [Geomonas nitrogeniifigens]QWV98770.1 magnesium-translocating P-type ATPase [Geomonas nitrogeniifigens]QXE87927.1 magnesium-translocating P-type ATPase [Geomonas nitrogeniifigens]
MSATVVKTDPSFWQRPIAALLEQLAAPPDGLDSTEAARRLVQFGPNLIHGERKRSLILQFLVKFRNPLVIILLTASALSAFTGDATSFFIIGTIVLISVTLDFVQEYRAGQAAERLRQSVAVRAQVLRDGKPSEIPIAGMVPGDVALLAAGDLIPCDGRVLEAKDFFVNQALLTGEAFPVEKAPSELPEETDVLVAGNTVLLGTSVISGTARVLMCRTGQDTELGAIADTLLAKPPPTAFEQGTRRFGLLIMRMTVLLVLFVLLVNAFFHRPWLESFLFAVALAVGLTPELLPMVVSVTLSRGALRMAAQKVIVKRLASIHNLGSMDVFCTDKTGTLTEARIHLERHQSPLGKESRRVLELAYYNSYFETGLKSPLDDAILEHTEIDASGWQKIDEVPFDFERRRISVLLDNSTTRMLVVKGAPEDILRLSEHYEGETEADQRPLDAAARQSINAQFEALSNEGFRVLGIATRQVGPAHPHAVVGDEADLVFAGFAAFLDPPKVSAKAALAGLAADRVAVKIITGDNELVTQHIFAQLGLPVTGVLTGSEIQQMDDMALAARVEQANLFCRVPPAQKNRVILALKRRGHVVGYLGDGINDAPSLHSADVGISVDSAVDVAKAAADMILLEQDLEVLHAGVLEGRRTFGNIMKYIMMGTSSNFGNMFSMAGASIFLPFLPMLPVQILLNNLLYDVSELPIPLDRVDDDYLSHPRHWDMNFIRNFMLVIGPVSSVFDFLTFYIMLTVFHAGEALFHTGWFIESMATQVLVIFIIRTRKNPFKSRPSPWLIACSLIVVALAGALPFTPAGVSLGFVAVPGYFFLILAAILLAYLLAVEGMKRWFFQRFVT